MIDDGHEQEIYLDHNATTPLDERVLEAMDPFLRFAFGNAASVQHGYGRAAADAIEHARAQVADLLGASPREIVFTSGATEANNLAIKGLALAATDRQHLVSCVTEHPAVLEPLAWLERRGFEVDLVEVDADGMVDLYMLKQVLRPDTLLVSVMAANNETGTLAPLPEIGRLAHRVGALFHTDATQLVGQLPIDLDAAQVDLLSLSAHKFYGPKGAGALYVQRRLAAPIEPLIHGGGHERGLRSGTSNVAGYVGLGTAARLVVEEGHAAASRLSSLRDELHGRLAAALDGVGLNGHPTHRLPSTVNLCFAGADADAVMANMPGVAVSSGSACSSATPAPSHVLQAMGRSTEDAAASIRFGVGRRTTLADVGGAVSQVVAAVTRVRGLINANEDAARRLA
jgi:cysteine desulfurase